MNRLFYILLLFIIFIFSCRSTKAPDIPEETELRTQQEKVVKIRTLVEILGLSDYSDLLEEEKAILIESYIQGMTLDEKIGQLFFLAIRHTAYGQAALEMDETIEQFMRNYKPAGIILFSINFDNPIQTSRLIEGLQSISSIPLFIAADEEGGKVSRLGDIPEMEVLSLPPAEEFGKKNDYTLTKESAYRLALDMKHLGFNMNMAPVADLAGVPSVIGNRSYGLDPETSSEMVAAVVQGFQQAGILSVLKHFPGHGNARGDSHSGAVSSYSSLSDFQNNEFLPFLAGIEAGSAFVMMAHMEAPALSTDGRLSSLSPQIQQNVLKGELGFDGLIISDAMDMGAIKNNFNAGEAALMAFHAGTDIILMPENIPLAQKTIKEAFLNGEISKQRLHNSLERILICKLNAGILNKKDSVISHKKNIQTFYSEEDLLSIFSQM